MKKRWKNKKELILQILSSMSSGVVEYVDYIFVVG